MQAEPRLEWERELLERGDGDTAAGLLEETLKQSHTLEPEEIEQIRQLAEQGRANASVLKRRQWNKVLRLADAAANHARASGL
jgi:hypothetical protein